MANTVNLGNVIGPKPQLTYVNTNDIITEVRDNKNRFFVDSKQLVTGYKYLYFLLASNVMTYTVNIYIPNSDTCIGQLTLTSPDQVETNTFRIMIPTPFWCSLDTDNVSAIRIVQVGYMWT